MRFTKFSALAMLSLIVYVLPAQAQIWKKVQQTLEDKASKKVENVLNGKKAPAAENGSQAESAGKTAPFIEEVYSFTPGNKVIFESDFKYDAKGSMPKKWKSSGSGSVITIPDMPGSWLALTEKSTYKIDSLLNMPGNFTIEFDLITRSSQSADIGSMSFGFARDNSIRNQLVDAYNGNAITNTQLHFHNQEITNSSSDTKIFSTLKYPLANYSNGLMHVAIAVEGETMRVYVNKSKVVDTRMFKPQVPKFFYLTAPYSYDEQSKVYFSNFVMSKQ